MKKIKVFIGSLVSLLTLTPALALAQNLPLSNLDSFLSAFQNLMNRAIPILIGLAVIVFLWGVLLFVFNASDPEKRKEGRMMMIWSIIGIVVMVSVWGLVYFVNQSFGLNTASHPTYPTI